jgi:hypothetical protein
VPPKRNNGKLKKEIIKEREFENEMNEEMKNDSLKFRCDPYVCGTHNNYKPVDYIDCFDIVVK